MKIIPRPYSLLAELTHRCPLHCPYCSNPLELAKREEELPASEWIRAIRQAEELGVLQIGFSGGEPLLYPELLSLIAEARHLDLYTNLITSGIGLTLERAIALRDAGLDVLQLSFQADDPTLADFIAGTRAHEQKRRAAWALQKAGIPWGANVVLHRQNIDRLSDMVRLASEWGALRIELANIQFYGWGFRNRTLLLPTHHQVIQAAECISQLQRDYQNRLQIAYILPDYYEKRPKPCLHGWGARAMTINPRGEVLPCQAANAIPELRFDCIQNHSLSWIWTYSDAFNKFRGTDWLPEPCRSCEQREIDFGGCRCQAALLTGSAESTDPVCEFAPAHGDLLTWVEQAASLPASTAYAYRAYGEK